MTEVDRILRPGGYWILSGPPIRWRKYWKGWERSREDLNAEQMQIENVTRNLCWKKLVEKDDIAIWQKPINHLNCKSENLCSAQDSDRAWFGFIDRIQFFNRKFVSPLIVKWTILHCCRYTNLETCLTPLPRVSSSDKIAGGELQKWPKRLNSVPPRVSSGSIDGVTAEKFQQDMQLWKRRVSYYKTVNNQFGQKGRYRNILDMNAFLGGFAANLVADPLWVMNIVPVEAKVNTLGAIYERGLIGTYQSWYIHIQSYLSINHSVSES